VHGAHNAPQLTHDNRHLPVKEQRLKAGSPYKFAEKLAINRTAIWNRFFFIPLQNLKLIYPASYHLPTALN